MLTERLQRLKHRTRAGEHFRHRKESAPSILDTCREEDLSWMQRTARQTRTMCEAQEPVIQDDELIAFTRTVCEVPVIYTADDYPDAAAGHSPREMRPVNNICADWAMALEQGLLCRRAVALASLSDQGEDPVAREFLECAIETIEATMDLAVRYEGAARRCGRNDLAEIFARVPAEPPRSFRDALQAIRLLHAVVWFGGNYHVGLGRFDQYMWPYLERDLDSGRLDREQATELVAEFFISMNRDSDLYPGIQQGDNGQSLMLGGVTPEGADACNELTRIALTAARDVAMIDPKINLRISTDTDLELLELASELTREGLGFPQYSNDDVVIPALIEHGYRPEDARDYTVAACWEFIIPGKGMEVVNVGAVSFPFAADRAIRQGLSSGRSFEMIVEETAKSVKEQVDDLVAQFRRWVFPPAPYYSVLMDGCLERGQDLSRGLRYNNLGIHGACAANAADALAAVKYFVLDEKSVEAAELLSALDADFSGYDSLRLKLIDDAPKVGKGSDDADAMLAALFDCFADACEEHKDNGRGGIVRPGTGSAMYYVWLATGHPGRDLPVVGATADGRRRGEYFGANLAPAQNVTADGPFSVLSSFSRIDYTRIYNGGPITLELSDTVFRDTESLRKVAMLVRTFAQLGCQQLQINSLNAETLLEAKAHPERHRNLIVRVWGWSGYFCELAPEYQDQIIARTMHSL